MTRVPLTFVRIQPYVSPKIELSDERQERVDLRVLPVIFRFENPKNLNLYPGQLVDVYVGCEVARRSRQRCVAACASCSGCVLAGCAVGPNFVRPRTAQVDALCARRADPVETVAAHGDRAALRVRRHSRPRTGGSCSSPRKLDAVDRGSAGRQPGSEAAQASLRQSEHKLRSGYGIFFPQVDADAARDARALLRRQSSARMQPAASSICSRCRRSVSYALDVFGGERRMIEGLHAQVDLQRATEQATYLTLIGEYRQYGHRQGRLPRGDRSDRAAHRAAAPAGQARRGAGECRHRAVLERSESAKPTGLRRGHRAAARAKAHAER